MIRSAHFKTISEDFAKIITPAIEVHVLQMPELQTRPVWVETESQKTPPPLATVTEIPNVLVRLFRSLSSQSIIAWKTGNAQKKQNNGASFLPIIFAQKKTKQRTLEA